MFGVLRLKNGFEYFKEELMALHSTEGSEEFRDHAIQLCEISRDLMFAFALIQHQPPEPNLVDVATTLTEAARLIDESGTDFPEREAVLANLRSRGQIFEQVGHGADLAAVMAAAAS